jgi:prevent-host-death family protein
MEVGSTNHKGAVAEAKIAAAAIELGIPVLRPQTEHGRYDLVFEVESRLVRVQCKWGRLVGDVVIVNLTSFRHNFSGSVYSRYSRHEIDAVAVYCGGNRTCYLLPVELVAEKSGVQLRLTPARNGQKASLNWASEYELSGAVAQLGERLRGTQEAVGSSPISSTGSDRSPPIVADIGAHEFRNRFGWYMERAAAGEEIRVSKRGRPYVRLLAA